MTKYLVLIGRTFIATFFLVNLFNIIPLNPSNNGYLTQISMLLVDTASLLLLGLACMKFSSVSLINNHNKLSATDHNKENYLIIREEKKY